MKLLTHNMLQCHIRGVKNGYPFGIEAVEVVSREVDMNADFLRNIFRRIDWPALKLAATALGYADLPAAATEADLANEDFLKKFHHALLELEVEEGNLVCPETGRKFNIKKGIPNLLLREDEVK